MVKTFQAYLPHCHRTYSCVHCRAHLANHDELISKSFQGSQGRAYLFNSVVNVGCGPAEERVLLTGLHAVADIYCECCKTTLGWKYEHAFESSQKYKEADIRLAKGQPSEGATTKLGEGRAPAVFYHDMTSTRHGHRSRPSSSSLIRFNGSQFSPQKQESPVGPVCQTPFSHLSVLSAMSR
ncbi:hypothetical protein RUM44_007638 [Polyplax serrata]|uniref:Yippee domain-containing protein n=1 Tax=Polyplax serrata TaxID=468196 RepID=A0ABR1B7Z9_POLSC